MTLYETMFITVPTLADDEAKSIIEMVGSTITDRQHQDAQLDAVSWGRTRWTGVQHPDQERRHHARQLAGEDVRRRGPDHRRGLRVDGEGEQDHPALLCAGHRALRSRTIS